jgi:hypothetical protein
MAVSSNRMQATELQQILGVSYETAWSMRKRLKGASELEKVFLAKLLAPE